MAALQEALAGTALDKLQTEDQTKLLNVIDRLRSQGVGGLLKDGLPQLIVCGDQSSGKSSVLDALTGVRFPTKSDICTTFATEIVLRRTVRTRIATKIKPGPSRQGEDRKRLEQFQNSFSSFDQFPTLIDSARECMRANTNSSANAIFDDILQVEINGPDLNPLTIVDLPGIIQYQNDQQSNKDVKLVEDLVRGYMRQENSIILAIVSAQNDKANQAVLRYAKEIVQDGRRTFGIITKPDTLEPGSEKEQKYLELPKNEEIPFQYGWHIVKNRCFQTRDITNEERDEQEKQFFEGSVWVELPKSRVILGIDALRKKLSTILLDHIRAQLPSILKTLNCDIGETESQLGKLGKARSTVTDQQDYLIGISSQFGRLTGAALRGDYHSDIFFNNLSVPEERKKRLRATVRNLNEDFADLMLRKGHRWEILDDRDLLKMSLPNQSEGPQAIIRSKFIRENVRELARQNRGQELDGTPNPLLVGYLFRQQSEPWEEIATHHLLDVTAAVKEFLDLTFGHLTPDERMCDKLLGKLIDPIMGTRKKHVLSKLQELLTPYKVYEPMNIDPQFSRTVQTLTDKQANDETVKNLQKCFGKDKQNPFAEKPTSELMDMAFTAEPDISDTYGCSTSLDRMEAYYKTAIILFINNVASLAVEQCLLAGLENIFTPASIRAISPEKLEAVAGESQDSKAERIRLTTKLEELEAGLKIIIEESPRETLRNADLINGTPNSRNAFTAAKKFTTADPATFDFLSQTPQPGKPKASFGWELGTLFGNAHTNTGQAPILPTPVKNAPSDSPVNFSAPPPKPSTPLFSGLQAKDPKGSNASGSPASTSKPSGSNLFGVASPSPAQLTASSSTPNVLSAVSKGTGLGSSALSPGTHKAGNPPPSHTETNASSTECHQAITFDPMYSQFSFEEHRLADYKSGYRISF